MTEAVEQMDTEDPEENESRANDDDAMGENEQ